MGKKIKEGVFHGRWHLSAQLLREESVPYNG